MGNMTAKTNNPNKTNPSMQSESNTKQETSNDILYILRQAIGYNDCSKIFSLISNERLDINYSNNIGLTPLFIAMRAGDLALIRAFLLMGADPNKYAQESFDAKQQTALGFAVELKNPAIIKLLVEHAETNKCALLAMTQEVITEANKIDPRVSSVSRTLLKINLTYGKKPFAKQKKEQQVSIFLKEYGVERLPLEKLLSQAKQTAKTLLEKIFYRCIDIVINSDNTDYDASELAYDNLYTAIDNKNPIMQLALRQIMGKQRPEESKIYSLEKLSFSLLCYVAYHFKEHAFLLNEFLTNTSNGIDLDKLDYNFEIHGTTPLWLMIKININHILWLMNHTSSKTIAKLDYNAAPTTGDDKNVSVLSLIARNPTVLQQMITYYKNNDSIELIKNFNWNKADKSGATPLWHLVNCLNTESETKLTTELLIFILYNAQSPNDISKDTFKATNNESSITDILKTHSLLFLCQFIPVVKEIKRSSNRPSELKKCIDHLIHKLTLIGWNQEEEYLAQKEYLKNEYIVSSAIDLLKCVVEDYEENLFDVWERDEVLLSALKIGTILLHDDPSYLYPPYYSGLSYCLKRIAVNFICNDSDIMEEDLATANFPQLLPHFTSNQPKKNKMLLQEAKQKCMLKKQELKNNILDKCSEKLSTTEKPPKTLEERLSNTDWNKADQNGTTPLWHLVNCLNNKSERNLTTELLTSILYSAQSPNNTSEINFKATKNGLSITNLLINHNLLSSCKFILAVKKIKECGNWIETTNAKKFARLYRSIIIYATGIDKENLQNEHLRSSAADFILYASNVLYLPGIASFNITQSHEKWPSALKIATLFLPKKIPSGGVASHYTCLTNALERAAKGYICDDTDLTDKDFYSKDFSSLLPQFTSDQSEKKVEALLKEAKQKCILQKQELTNSNSDKSSNPSNHSTLFKTVVRSRRVSCSDIQAPCNNQRPQLF